jgi:hypothetical protein
VGESYKDEKASFLRINSITAELTTSTPPPHNNAPTTHQHSKKSIHNINTCFHASNAGRHHVTSDWRLEHELGGNNTAHSDETGIFVMGGETAFV